MKKTKLAIIITVCIYFCTCKIYSQHGYYNSFFEQFEKKSRYKIISENNYDLTTEKNNPKKYIPIEKITKNKKLLKTSTNPDSLIIGACYLLSKKHFRKVELHLESENKHKTTPLIQCLYHLCRGNFEKANTSITNYQNRKYEFLKSLLIADCFYELNKYQKKTEEVIKKYQYCLDISITEKQKEIINHRIKLIRYGI